MRSPPARFGKTPPRSRAATPSGCTFASSKTRRSASSSTKELSFSVVATESAKPSRFVKSPAASASKEPSRLTVPRLLALSLSRLAVFAELAFTICVISLAKPLVSKSKKPRSNIRSDKKVGVDTGLLFLSSRALRKGFATSIIFLGHVPTRYR